MTEDQQLELDNAIELAVASHQGQRDKQGQPYILHALRVMIAVAPLAHLMIPAVLHDVVEDTGITVAELPEHGISVDNAAVVDVLTRRDGEDYLDYIRRVKLNPYAMAIKVADLHDNVNRITGLPDKEEARRLLSRYEQALSILY